MSYLLDTCVVSDLAKPRTPAGLRNWAVEVDWSRCYLSALCFGELRVGIERLEDGARRRRIEDWLGGALREQFAQRILPVNEAVAERWGILRVAVRALKQTPPIIDSLLAATALHHRLTMVTRNVADFEPFGVAILDPWSGK